MDDVEQRIAAGVPASTLTADVVRGRMRTALFGEPTRAPGSTRYTILERLGEGGMGTVWAAWDGKLDRKVALKLLRPEMVDDPAAAHRRILREAQALARVSDPHVVAVFDVTSWSPPDAPEREHVLLAMEFIAGEPLSTWLERPHPLREVVEKLVAAARGLVAAHGAGVIHGDFKPANVIVGRDGRPRVVDFGLARVALDPARTTTANDVNDPDERAPAVRSLEQTGGDARVAGTPLFMAPEQHEGRGIDARADQYALCVSLWQAVTGHAPFSGTTMTALYEAKLAFESRRAPAGMPGWLHRVLVRGLAPRPGDRFASIEVLVAALQRGLAPRWRMPALITVLAAATGAVVWARDVDPCEGGDARIAEVWGGSKREHVEAAFERTSVGYAAATSQSTSAALDAWSDVWRTSWRDACESHRSGAQSDALFDLRMTCLERRLAHLEALVALFGEADAATVENAVQAASRLPGLKHCADTEALRNVVPMPDDPDERAHVIALGRKVATARAELDAGRYASAATTAGAVEQEARARPAVHLPLIAEAVAVRAEARGWLGELDAAIVDWRESSLLATRAGDDDMFVRAAAGLVWELANAGKDHALARDWGELADAALARAGELPHAEYLVRNAIGTLALSELRFDEARAQFERGLALVERTWGPTDYRNLVLHANLGNAEVRADHVDAAVLHYRAAIDIGITALGREHPRVAMTRYGLAIALIGKGRSADGIAELERLIEDQTRAYGADHPQLGSSYASLAMAETNLERVSSARAHADRALELLRGQPGAGYVRVVARLSRARAELALGDAEAAEADANAALTELHEGPFTPADESEARAILAAIALARPRGRDVQPELMAAWSAGVAANMPRDAGAALRQLAELERSRARPELALWWITASILELGGEPSHLRNLVQSEVLLAELLLDLGLLDRAEAQLAHAAALLAARPSPIEWHTDLVLARARLAWRRGDRAHARALVQTQHDALPPSSIQRQALAAWQGDTDH